MADPSEDTVRLAQLADRPRHATDAATQMETDTQIFLPVNRVPSPVPILDADTGGSQVEATRLLPDEHVAFSIAHADTEAITS